jgi:hypothetical protein
MGPAAPGKVGLKNGSGMVVVYSKKDSGFRIQKLRFN